MNVKQVIQEKELVETRIRAFVDAELKRFNAETGISIESVYVDILELDVVGDKIRKYIVQGVSCDIVL